uniref:HMA domain-containing protein n=1 Tax=Oryza barthii TaxID=65489 RepID=A0A0D3FXL5_9ORYZ
MVYPIHQHTIANVRKLNRLWEDAKRAACKITMAGIMDEENASSTNSIKLELRIYMHCKACERSVRRAIEKIDGVEKVEVERGENKVTVTGGGDFEPEKAVRRIKKKTGKKVEILALEEEDDDHEEDGGGGADAQAHHEFQRHGYYVPYYHHRHHHHLVPVPPPDNGGGGTADVAHEFQRRGGVGHYGYYAPCYYDGGGGGGDVAHEIQRPVRSAWDLHGFDDENTQACRVT